MATFQTQLQNLAGTQDTPDTTAMSDWLTAGAREVLNILPLPKLMRIVSTSVFENTIDVEGKKVLGVLREDAANSDLLMPCRLVPPTQKGRIQDSNYMESATTSDPAYWIDGDTLQVFPTSVSTNDMSLVYVNAGITVAYNESSIANFPDEAEYLVVLFATRKYLQKLLSDNEDEWYQIQYQMVDNEYQQAIKVLQGGL